MTFHGYQRPNLLMFLDFFFFKALATSAKKPYVCNRDLTSQREFFGFFLLLSFS